MTAEDSCKRQEMLQQKLQRLAEPPLLVQRAINQINAPLRALRIWERQLDLFPRQFDNIARVYQHSAFAAVSASHANLLKAIKGYERLANQRAFYTFSPPLIDISTVMQSVTAAVAAAQPLIPPDRQEEFRAEVLPKVEECKTKKLTIGDILSLISLLFTIYFGIVSSLPDEQLDRIAKQNEIIIEQQEEMIELKKEDAELRNALDALSNSIDLLADEVESLRNQAENVGNISELDGQSDAENRQQQHRDSQD